MIYEDLTIRIENAEIRRELKSSCEGRDFWRGYIAALNDIRSDLNMGVDNVRS